MPSNPLTNQDIEAIRELSRRVRSDDRGALFADDFVLRDQYATGEVVLSRLTVNVWQEAWTALLEVAEQLNMTPIYKTRTLRNMHTADYGQYRILPYGMGLLKEGSPPSGWKEYQPRECGCNNYMQAVCGCGNPVGCMWCGYLPEFYEGTSEPRQLVADSEGAVACESCLRECTYEGCGLIIHPAGWRCNNHSGPDYGELTCCYCSRRGYYEDSEYSWQIDSLDRDWCGPCWANRPRCSICDVDGAETELEFDEDDGYGPDLGGLCSGCRMAQREKITEKITFDYANTPVTPNMLEVAALPDRPPRAVSVEQEMTIGGREGQSLASNLHELGLSPYGEIEGYHSSGHDGFVHMETDSSISGYELIYNRVDFSQESEQSNAAKVIEAVAAAGSSFDATCGTHFHIDMHGLDVRDTKNLVIVYSYLEDPIYRVAAAGYDAHRSNLREGRVYAQSIQKQEWRDVRHFGREFLRRAAHDDSLNLQHYYQAMRNCDCGAIEFGQQKECDCNLGKLTAEWRVFNGTNDPRKLRAWLALAQACVAYAQDRDIRYSDFRPLSYGQSHDRAAAEERLRWMLGVLPMTEAEKADIVWCLKNTQLSHSFTEGELEGFVQEYRPERELPPAPKWGFRSSLRVTPEDRVRMIAYMMDRHGYSTADWTVTYEQAEPVNEDEEVEF